MILSKTDLLSAARGAIAVSAEDEYLALRRYSESQEDYYEDNNADFRQKCRAGAGICLDFTTDAKKLSFQCKLARASSRSFYSFELYIDGAFYQRVGEDKLSERKRSVEFDLPEGKKRLSLWFPCLFKALIKDFTLEDASIFQATKLEKTILCIGDSITHGYDAQNPTNSYPSRIARHFDCNVINQGIGGDVYHAGNLGDGIGIKPDLITVALGTNDWSNRTKERFDDCVEEFYNKLSELYPNIPLVVITPFWRGNFDRITKVGSFDYAAEKIIDCAKVNKKLTVVDGKTLIDHDPKFFSPDVLHPNDEGFEMLAERLFPVLEKLL